ncbi:AAA family ATPase [Paracerasibacillus soli]|uniref:AAA family ATPase n=1 Tax=Paracerasibacillus soli TaxID=480284 RepID=A0ABU5CP96_9BACI|nr:AAA family ATPase [Virgibacillus soli]MDY0408178.1 AAA family ATPase [Virgibacillus soli]
MSDQAAKLRKQLLEDENNHRAKTISVVSGKGGVGKSNISINLSIELLKLGKKVLLIDMDFGMGNVDVLLGLQAKRTIVDLFQHYDTFQEIIEIGPHHLAYISGGSGLTNIFSIKQDRLDFFFEQFEQAVTEYDYIFFDIGAGLQKQICRLYLQQTSVLL